MAGKANNNKTLVRFHSFEFDITKLAPQEYQPVFYYLLHKYRFAEPHALHDKIKEHVFPNVSPLFRKCMQRTLSANECLQDSTSGGPAAELALLQDVQKMMTHEESEKLVSRFATVPNELAAYREALHACRHRIEMWRRCVEEGPEDACWSQWNEQHLCKSSVALAPMFHSCMTDHSLQFGQCYDSLFMQSLLFFDQLDLFEERVEKVMLRDILPRTKHHFVEELDPVERKRLANHVDQIGCTKFRHQLRDCNQESRDCRMEEYILEACDKAHFWYVAID